MAFVLGEPTVQQYFDSNGDPLVNGTIEFYVTNTTTPATIYSDSIGTAIGTSVTLNSIGAPANSGVPVALFFDTDVTYKIVRKDAAGTEIAPTIDPFNPTGGDSDDSTELLTDYNAVGDGVTNDTTAVHNWLNAAMASGKRARAPAGTYLMDSYAVTTMTGDIEVECDRNAVFKYRTAESAPLFSFGHTSAGVYGIRWHGGQMDNSGGAFASGAQSNTCLELERLINYEVVGVHFKGEASYDDANTVPTGTDSGITTVNCARGRIHSNVFEGQGDAGIYLSGGALTASSDDGGQTLIFANHFLQCDIAITAKRDVDRTLIYGNEITDCRVGIINLEANSVDPGRMHQIYGNNLKRIETRAIELRVNDGWQVFGNTIEDWGYESDGTTVSSEPRAIVLEGSDNCDIHDNIIRMSEWSASVSHHGIYVDEETVNSVLYTPANNYIRNNRISDCEFGITEGTVGQNRYADNIFENVTTDYNSMDASALVKRIDTGDSQLALTNVGNVGAGEDDLQTLTIPANTLKSNTNRIIKVRAWGLTAGNANAKTLKFHFGSTVIDTVTLTTSQASNWAFDVVITGSTSQNVYSEFTQGGATAIHQIARSNPSETITSAIVVKCTGEGVADDDVVSDGMTLEIVR